MKTLKGVCIGAALSLLALLPFGIGSWSDITAAQDRPVQVEKVRIYTGDKRPFSWYYPYSYQYYYPRHQNNSCYWLYTNGTYVYTCS